MSTASVAIDTGKRPNPSIYFMIGDETLLELRPGKFMVKGEEVQDAQKVYEGFCAWLRLVQEKDGLQCIP